MVKTMVTPICNCVNPVISYITFNQIPESPTVTPTTSTQVVLPSAKNKYLAQVTVNPIPTTPAP
jgi:hypothetical protein